MSHRLTLPIVVLASALASACSSAYGQATDRATSQGPEARGPGSPIGAPTMMPPGAGGGATIPGDAAGGDGTGLGGPAGDSFPPGFDGGGGAGGAAFSSGLGEAASGAASAFGMIGDRSPFAGVRVARLRAARSLPRTQFTRDLGGLSALQSHQEGERQFIGAVAGGFKIADNQSPIPQDRVFASVFYFDNLFASINRRLNSSIRDERVTRQVYGFETTFIDQRISLGLQLPVNTFSFKDPTFGGTTTAFGDLTVVTKFRLLQDSASGSLLSAGLALTPPSGNSHFAGFKVPGDINTPVRTTDIQPFVGYFLARGRWYVQGFTALSTPASGEGVTVLSNDLGVGYYLYRADAPARGITAVAPTLEVHVNDPLNHRRPSEFDPIGVKDVVDLTYGLNIELGGHSVLSGAFVTPVTGPRPFDYEVIALLNVRFGPSKARRLPPPNF